jgi:hypothetical protein
MTSQTRSEELRADVLERFDLGVHELVVLDEACATLDTCDELAEVVDRDGMVVAGNGGVPKMHPAVVELRHQRTTLARLLVALRVPYADDDGGGEHRSQRRGIRGVHS